VVGAPTSASRHGEKSHTYQEDVVRLICIKTAHALMSAIVVQRLVYDAAGEMSVERRDAKGVGNRTSNTSKWWPRKALTTQPTEATWAPRRHKYTGRLPARGARRERPDGIAGSLEVSLKTRTIEVDDRREVKELDAPRPVEHLCHVTLSESRKENRHEMKWWWRGRAGQDKAHLHDEPGAPFPRAS